MLHAETSKRINEVVSSPTKVLKQDARPAVRPQVAGKLLHVNGEPFLIKGVSYGAFRPDKDKKEYWDHAQIDRDFELMAANGVNTVRVPHTMPPVSLLDCAQKHGLMVMVGLSAEQYVGYLIDKGKKDAPDVPALTREKVRTVAGHPALLCYAIGNEISPASARWLGKRKIERYLKSLHDAIKAEDPAGLVTYVNYPTTEYLQLPFLDFLSFNVYLETPQVYRSYLMRLQNLAGDRPLLMSEIGLDAMRNGEEQQAESVSWQIREAFACGCAGAVIFSWTDEWHRAGEEVDDWAFGLTTREREPKPALRATTEAFADAPLRDHPDWPSFSVVVCSYNGARTIAQCLEGLSKLTYPKFEVIVVDDGSTDETATIASRFDCNVISIPNGGLSNARNVGAQAATGDVIAYLDDDAFPTTYWLHFLAEAYRRSDHVGMGGPNVPPHNVNAVAKCVDNAPGGPTHVLLTDEVAEHLPGCNLSIRRDALEAIGGFDPKFRCAGDDVDVCWRLQAMGGTLGFSPGAVVWHHRRHTVSGYLKQQKGYGKAESLLEQKWPDKYNASGHHTFVGRIYGRGVIHALFRLRRVYHGVGGFAPFQSVYERSPGMWTSLPMMPEWYLIIGVLTFFTAMGVLWWPLFMVAPLLLLTIGLTISHCFISACEARFPATDLVKGSAWKRRCLIACLHLLQPLARLQGRIGYGLTAWRRRCKGPMAVPRQRSRAQWTEDWQAPEARYAAIESSLRASRGIVRHGSEFDRWDMEVEGGMLAGVRMMLGIEDHGAGTQYVRVKSWPRTTTLSKVLIGLFTLVTTCALVSGAWVTASVLGACAAVIAFLVWSQAATACGLLQQTLNAVIFSSPDDSADDGG